MGPKNDPVVAAATASGGNDTMALMLRMMDQMREDARRRDEEAHRREEALAEDARRRDEETRRRDKEAQRREAALAEDARRREEALAEDARRRVEEAKCREDVLTAMLQNLAACPTVGGGGNADRGGQEQQGNAQHPANNMARATNSSPLLIADATAQDEKQYQSEVNAVSKLNDKAGNQGRQGCSQSRSRYKGGKESKFRGNNDTCGPCGKNSHPRSECPARDRNCHHCGIQGHFSIGCFKKKAGLPPVKGSADVKKTGRVKIARTTNSDPPREEKVLMQAQCGKHRGKILVVPDTGAQASIMPMHIMQKLGIKRSELQSSNTTFMAANDKSFRPLGTLRCKLSVGDIEHEETVYVCSDVSDFLLAREALKQLQIIPMDFPKQISSQIRSVKSVTNDKEQTLPEDKIPGDGQSVLMSKYADVFYKGPCLKAMKGDPMKIQLLPDVQPTAVSTARPIPFAVRPMVEEELKLMESQGIIVPVGEIATPWCSPQVPVRKADGSMRVCIDYGKLNKFVQRPVHPMRVSKDAIDSIKPDDKYFTTMDAMKGYWQIPLDEESQNLTTFITSKGRFKFLRAPMGLNASGDEFNRRLARIFSGIANVEVVVDDLLVHTSSYDEHVKIVTKVLERCLEHGVTLNPKKFNFAKAEVNFVGYHIGPNGVAADPSKLDAIAKFPIPSNITDLKSFLGLVNQLGAFSRDVSATAGPLRPLLKKSNAFVWNANHTEAFDAVKKALCATPVLRPFDPNLKTILLTDASRLHGLGFALMQREGEQDYLIQCGSRFLKDAETRYAVCELEMLAVAYAMDKCRLYLMGLQHFDLVTDHKPLVPILNDKTLDVIENPRLMRLKEKIMPYNFTAEWRKGKHHQIADALSRAPILDPSAEDDEMAEELHVLMCSQIKILASNIDDDDEFGDVSNVSDPILSKMAEAAKDDPDYQRLIEAVQTGFQAKSSLGKLNLYYKLREFLSVEDGLVLYHSRIVVPKDQRSDVLKKLHASHQGIDRTKRRARQTVYWPGLTSDIMNMVAACASCQERRPSLPHEPLLQDPMPSRPFQETAADLFYHAGKHYIVYVDRFSGWPEVASFGSSDPNADSVIWKIRSFFGHSGVPIKFRSDGGPQFTSATFRHFMLKWGIRHVFSAPHYPQSNGLAESAVKAMKNLIASATVNGRLDSDEFVQGLIEFRNTPRANGKSPAQMVFGRPMRSDVPAHASSFAQEWVDAAKTLDTCDESLSEDMKSHVLKPIATGQHVWLQDPSTKRWSSTGIVVRAKGRNYMVKMPSGNLLKRNRIHIRPYLMEENKSTGCKEKMRISFSNKDHVKVFDPGMPPSALKSDVRPRKKRNAPCPARYRD
jgi:transposase InsO family protein